MATAAIESDANRRHCACRKIANVKSLVTLLVVFLIIELRRMGSVLNMQHLEELQQIILPNDISNKTVEEVRNRKSTSFFDQAAQEAQHVLLRDKPSGPRKKFDVNSWTRKTKGGLYNADRPLLGKIYGEADSVFEWGLGESTWIASHVGVPRYAGIDSDAAWVAYARDDSLPHFRFYLADIGKTTNWGYPEKELTKAYLDYQLAPMLSEQLPFDVYMVDGRYRLACMLIAFLHASARGADPSHTTVLLHDCYREGEGPKSLDRPQYRKADHLLDLVDHSGNRLCVYKRKNDTTDQQLYDLWRQEYQVLE